MKSKMGVAEWCLVIMVVFIVGVVLLKATGNLHRNFPLPEEGWKEFNIVSVEGEPVTLRCPVKTSHPYGRREYTTDCYIIEENNNE